MYIFFVFLLLLSSSLCAKEKCETCQDIVKKFQEGMERTSGHNFGGGNTDWEETRLGSWADSETRLVDIIENVCSSTECHSMVEEHEEDIEHWWFKQKSKGVELESWLCIDTVKVCCPSGKFGRNCEECPGGVETPCSNHGKCKGDGTRTGSGECECDDGYTSKSCNECDEGFYQDPNNSSEVSCLKCHESCDGGCHEGSPKGCESCKDGWEESEEDGCVDKDECTGDVCESNKYCVNTPGSFKCEACDRSCEENCTGPGNKACLSCKAGYEMKENEGCIDIDECADENTKCDDGKYCDNKPGSFACVECDKACSQCSGPGTEKCSACNAGFQLNDNGCEDIDECADENTKCDDNKYCANNPGSFACLDCDKACSQCSGPGAENCTACSSGFESTEKGCQDVDECKNKKLCPRENEHCKNMPGFYSCKCDSGYTRKEGKCVKDKKKKKSKTTKTEEEKMLEDVEKEEKPEKENDDVTKDDEDDDVDDDVGDDDVDDDEADEKDLEEAMHAEL